MTTSVSFEVAKLLKEKGFNEETNKYYVQVFNDVFKLTHHRMWEMDEESGFQNAPHYLAPTIAEVVMWLYEKHGIFIQLFPIGEDNKMKFYSKIIVNDNGWVKIKHQISTIVNSPAEAYLSAIQYTLNNLI